MRCSRNTAEQWRELKNAIIEGKVQTITAMEFFLENLRREKKLNQIKRKKSSLPIIQSVAVFMSGFVFYIFSFFIFPDTLKPGLFTFLLFISAQLICYLWIQNIFKKWKSLQKQGLWIQLLYEYQQGLLSGQTLFTLLQCERKNSLRKKIFSQSPNRLMQQQWKQLLKLDDEGKPLSLFLGSCLKQFQNYFEYQLEIEGDRLSMKLLMPIFFCQLPSQIFLIIAPFLGEFLKALP
jgi:hypothetical protein